MANWIIPCNPKYFDIFGAFAKMERLDWGQTAKSIEEGDTVYIYVAKPVQAIMFKCIVTKTNIPEEDEDDSDESFDLEDRDTSPNLLSMRLELVKKYNANDLTYAELKARGLKGSMQGQRRTDGIIQELIDEVDT